MFWRSCRVLQTLNLDYLHQERIIMPEIKTILFDILDFWCQLEVIRFVKTLLKRRMFVSFMKISACWLLHRLIKFNKICWEKRPVQPRPNLRTSFYRRDLKNTQPHLTTVAERIFETKNPAIFLERFFVKGIFAQNSFLGQKMSLDFK